MLIDSALNQMAQVSFCDRPTLYGWALEAYREIFSRALDEGDYSAATRAVKELTALASNAPTDPESPD